MLREKSHNKQSAGTKNDIIIDPEKINSVVTSKETMDEATASMESSRKYSDVVRANIDTKATKKREGVHMKDQLLYLANLLGFEVNTQTMNDWQWIYEAIYDGSLQDNDLICVCLFMYCR